MKPSLEKIARVSAILIFAVSATACSAAHPSGVIPGGTATGNSAASTAHTNGIPAIAPPSNISGIAIASNVKPMDGEVYSAEQDRPLDSYDDSDWWTNGGSYGQVDGGGGGCSGTRCGNGYAAGSAGAGQSNIGRGSNTTPMCQGKACQNSDLGSEKDNGTTAVISRSGNGRAKPHFGGQMVLECWYQAVTPGVHDPLHDTPLGCDYIDFGGIPSTGAQFSPGVHGGVPIAGSSCDNAPLAVGDGFIPVGGNGNVINVTSESGVWSYGTVVGWLYMGSDGHQYAQPNTAAEPSFIPGASTAGYLFTEFFGFPAVPGFPDTSVAQMPAGQHLTHSARAAKCHTRGSDLG